MNQRLAVIIGVVFLLSAFVSLGAGYVLVEYRTAALLSALMDIIAAIVFFGIAYWKRNRML